VSPVSNTRRECVAFVEVMRIIAAAILGAIDYKRTFAGTYASDEERLEAYSQCHLRSANRVLRALLANGGKPTTIHHTEKVEAKSIQGVFIKLGQHMASL
jgi:aarF domain-containing kinase